MFMVLWLYLSIVGGVFCVGISNSLFNNFNWMVRLIAAGGIALAAGLLGWVLLFEDLLLRNQDQTGASIGGMISLVWSQIAVVVSSPFILRKRQAPS